MLRRQQSPKLCNIARCCHTCIGGKAGERWAAGNRCDCHRSSGKSAERWINFTAYAKASDIAGKRIGRGSAAAQNISLIFGQAAAAFKFKIDIQPRIFADFRQRRFKFFVTKPAFLRQRIIRLRIKAGIIIFQDKIHHALIGAVSILQRNFFRKNLHLLDRLGRQVAQFAEAGNALPVEQYDRRSTAPSATRTRLRSNGRQNICDRRTTNSGDVGFA